MKKLCVILLSVLAVFLMGCEKDEFLPKQQGESLTTEFRTDSPNPLHRPAWISVIHSMGNYIDEMVEGNILPIKSGFALKSQAGKIEEQIVIKAFDAARKEIKIFRGEVEKMVESGGFPSGRAQPLLEIEEKLDFILDGKLVEAKDGFEGYAVGDFPSDGGWVLKLCSFGEEHQVVTGQNAFKGDRSLKMKGGFGQPAVAFLPIEETPEVVFVESAIRVDHAEPGMLSYSNASFGLFNPEEGEKGAYHALVTFESNGYIFFGTDDSYDNKLQAWKAGEWYTIRIMYNNKRKSGSVWVNGQLLLEDISLQGPEGAYSALALGSGLDYRATTFFDEVMIWTPVP